MKATYVALEGECQFTPVREEECGGDLQHDNGDSKGGLGLHAVAAVLLVADDAAAFGDVPRCALVLVRRVDSVGRGLDV